MTKGTGGQLIDGTDYAHSWSSVIIFAMVFYVASYATGLGNVPWQQGEFFSLEGMCLLFLPSSLSLVSYSPYSAPSYSPRHRHLPRHRHKLVRQPAHRIDLPLPHGQNHARRRIRVLRRSLFTRLCVRRVLFPGDGGAELGGGEDGV